MTALRNISKTCGFCDHMKDKLLMDRLLLGVHDDRMREKMMSAHELTLAKALEICKAVEAADVQMKALKQAVDVSKVDLKNPRDKGKKNTS